MPKFIGYIISAVGLAGLAAYTNTKVAQILMLSKVNPTILLIASGAIVLAGLFLTLKSGGSGGHHRQKGAEVPIFHGKEIVGYRRI